MKIAISPYSTNKTKPSPHNYATKVQLFWERFHGWKLDIAKKMLDGYEAEEGKSVPGIQDSGFAAMDVMFSYFEPLGKHLDGYLDPNDCRKSGYYFKQGMKDVFDFSEYDPGVVDELLSKIWTGIRCGLYHAGQTKKGILIMGGTSEVITFNGKVVLVNPHRLADRLIEHVAIYRDKLLEEGEDSDLGKKFVARYDYENPTH